MESILAEYREQSGKFRPDPYKILLIDVSRAHFYADVVRDVYIQLPEEDPRSKEPGICGKLEKTMYGTLDAAERWGEHYATTNPSWVYQRYR